MFVQVSHDHPPLAWITLACGSCRKFLTKYSLSTDSRPTKWQAGRTRFRAQASDISNEGSGAQSSPGDAIRDSIGRREPHPADRGENDRRFQRGKATYGKHGGRDRFDWSAFTALCDRAGLWSFLYLALLLRGASVAESRSRSDHAAISQRNAARRAETGRIAFRRFHPPGRTLVWTERYMWADRIRPRLRQFVVEIGMQNHLNSREISTGVEKAGLPSVSPRLPKSGQSSVLTKSL